MSNQKVVKDVICIIERDHPIISRKSCVIDVLLWEARRQGKEEEMWRIFKPYSQSMDVNELDKAIEEIAKLLGVRVEYRYI
jgi:flagellar biosynthesis/type III secretory pathway chaperone